ncbi:glycoside hydrolase family 71 protein [Georgenia sp. SYP-B2076]|uniref:glycoside hydrolase family 71 protein n=1 Tax=Georgenia sp. SYP-B2076 TaxID=2495881 RepID=UPI000F8DBD24|nr:glycoside hydrolase family 71 protein [Georgenia sp. SYP-B2076]
MLIVVVGTSIAIVRPLVLTSPRDGSLAVDATPPPAAAPPVPPSGDLGGGPLAVDVAGVGQGKKVFAHYFPPYPISFNNQAPASDYYTVNYLAPDGEGGKHRAYGGLLRDRPIARQPLAGDWAQADMRAEVKQAADAGIDGFFVVVLSLSGGNWDRTIEVMEAAQASGRGFVVAPQLDTTASAGQAPVAEVAAKMAQLARMPAAYRLGSGEFVLSAFKAEGRPASWWSSLMGVLQNQYGIKTVFMPVFLDASRMTEYAGISYAMGNWGVRNPGNTLAGPNYAAQAHALGSRWIAPVSVQDERPNQGVYWEAGNLGNLRASWSRAIGDGADFALLTTWNDYSENTSFAPSASHGYAFLDVNAYYLTQFKTGAVPRVVRDAVYVTHRTQPVTAQPTLPHRLMALQHGDRDPARDTVEVQTFFTAPAAVTVTVGSATHTYTAPAGVGVKSFPLQTGNVGASAVRNGRSIGVAASPYPVTTRPDNQDLQYYAVSSRR